MIEYVPRYKESPEWTMEVECFSNGLGYEEETPCHTITKITEYDINYDEVTLGSGEVAGLFSYMCPVCHKCTIIDDNLLPIEIREYVIDNNGFDVPPRVLK